MRVKSVLEIGYRLERLSFALWLGGTHYACAQNYSLAWWTVDGGGGTSTVVLWWPLPAEDWLLHATTDLLTRGSVWTEILPPYQTNGPNLRVTEPAPTPRKFYRLHKP